MGVRSAGGAGGGEQRGEERREGKRTLTTTDGYLLRQVTPRRRGKKVESALVAHIEEVSR